MHLVLLYTVAEMHIFLSGVDLKAGTHYPYVRTVRNDRTYGPYVRASFFCARTSDPYVRSILTVRKSQF